eukprot:COSAG06_NODE_5147_length_3681_cov_2.151870_2_plen_277_part_00
MFAFCTVTEALTTHHQLTDLNVSQNGLGKNGSKKVEALLRQYTKLKVLDIGGNAMGPSVRRILDTIVDDQYTLRTLRMGGNYAFAREVLQSNSSSNVGESSRMTLAACIHLLEATTKKLSNFTELDLSDNNLGHEDATRLSTALSNSRIKVFTLQHDRQLETPDMVDMLMSLRSTGCERINFGDLICVPPLRDDASRTVCRRFFDKPLTVAIRMGRFPLAERLIQLRQDQHSTNYIDDQDAALALHEAIDVEDRGLNGQARALIESMIGDGSNGIR